MFGRIKKAKLGIEIGKLVDKESKIRNALKEMDEHYGNVQDYELPRLYPYAYKAWVNLMEELYSVTSDLYALFLESNNMLMAEAEQVNLTQIGDTIMKMKSLEMMA